MSGEPVYGRPYTSEELEAGVLAALAAHDAQAVHDLLLAMATVDAKRAGELYDLIRLGLALRGKSEAPR